MTFKTRTKKNAAENSYRESLNAELAKVNVKHAVHCAANNIEREAGFVQALIWYVEDLVRIGGPRKEVLAPSSIMHYTNQLLPHLTRLEGCGLHEVATAQRQEVYAAAMLNEKGEARQDLEKLLRLFEQTLLDSRVNLF